MSRTSRPECEFASAQRRGVPTVPTVPMARPEVDLSPAQRERRAVSGRDERAARR